MSRPGSFQVRNASLIQSFSDRVPACDCRYTTAHLRSGEKQDEMKQDQGEPPSIASIIYTFAHSCFSQTAIPITGILCILVPFNQPQTRVCSTSQKDAIYSPSMYNCLMYNVCMSSNADGVYFHPTPPLDQDHVYPTCMAK